MRIRRGRESVSKAGYLYLILFDNGVLKAGRTEDPDARRERHLRDAGRYRIRIINEWFSDLIDHPARDERTLLAVLDRIGRRTDAGREYYLDVPFTIARYQAKHLDQTTRCPQCTCPGI